MNVKKRTAWYLLIFLGTTLFLFLTSCSDKTPTGGEDNPPEKTDPNTVSRDIGPAGGTITSKDGRVTLDFPEGALSSTETITITPIDEDDLGPEFEEVLNEFGFGKAYEMGPDGLSFEEPVTVTFQSDQVVVQEGDSVRIVSELLFTDEGDEAVTLDSLRMTVEEETGKTIVSGELHHFSELLAAANFNHWVVFKVLEVPDDVAINDKFIVQGRIASGTSHLDATYVDLSEHPIHRDFNPSNQLMQHVLESYSNALYPYTCTQVGMGTFKAEGQVIISKDVDKISNNIFLDGLVVQKQVNCFLMLNIPKLKSPAKGATDVELKTTLEWETVENVTGYTVQIVEEGKEFSDNDAVELDVTGPSAEASGLKPNTTYKWRVRANNDNEGAVSGWSEVWMFTTKKVEFGFGDLKVCVEHGTTESDIFWLWAVYGSLLSDYSEILVTLIIEYSDGTEVEITASPTATQALFLALKIYSYGDYKWRIKEVKYKGQVIEYSAETSSGEVNVTSEEQNPFECTP